MSTFDDLFNQKPKQDQPEEFILIDGTFVCDYCNEYLDEARYYVKGSRLEFGHSVDGELHNNVVDGFKLF